MNTNFKEKTSFVPVSAGFEDLGGQTTTSNRRLSATLARALAAVVAIQAGCVSVAGAQATLPTVTVVGVSNGQGGFGFGGSGGSWGGGATDFFNDGAYNSGMPFDEPPGNVMTCEYLDANWPVGCHRTQRPGPLAGNGCGTATTSFIGNGPNGAFFDACNSHDTCYGTLGGRERSSCDHFFGQGMHQGCIQTFEYRELPPGPDRQEAEQAYHDCNSTADAWHAQLRDGLGVWQFAAIAFDRSRKDAECRNAHALRDHMGCPF